MCKVCAKLWPKISSWDNWSEHRNGNLNVSWPIVKEISHSPLFLMNVPLAAFNLMSLVKRSDLNFGEILLQHLYEITHLHAPESHRALNDLLPALTITAHSFWDFLLIWTFSVSVWVFTLLSIKFSKLLSQIWVCLLSSELMSGPLKLSDRSIVSWEGILSFLDPLFLGCHGQCSSPHNLTCLNNQDCNHWDHLSHWF